MLNKKNLKFSLWKKLIYKVFGQPQNRHHLIKILRQAEKNKLIDDEVLNMLEGALQVSTMQARDIMIPRPQVTSLDQYDSLKTVLTIVTQTKHSRYPVMNEDEVVGILLAKELLQCLVDESSSFDLSQQLRPALFIPESKRLNTLLHEFRHTKNHMAIVVDEYGKVAGLVTLEDVLEQIVGDIADEKDRENQRYIHPHPDGHVIVKAITPMENFNEYFDPPLPHEGCDSVGGLIIKYFGHLPKRHQEIKIGPYLFRVLNADNRRVRVLGVRRVV